jgi:hypothetical protein
VTDQRRTRPFLSPLLLLVALLTTLGLNMSSATASVGPETRVRASDHSAAIVVGSETTERPASVGCLRPPEPGFVSGSCVATEAVSPVIDPAKVGGMSPAEVDAFAQENGLIPKGPDPAAGKGAHVDPVTGEQRILCHPDGCGGGHLHVNDPTGQRLDIGGNPVAPESPAAHLPGMFSRR